MVSVKLLESEDVILPDDWVRQLVFWWDGETPQFFSVYSGRPVNSMYWTKMEDFSPYHSDKGLTVAEFNVMFGQHEFIRGEVPLSHKEKYYVESNY